MANQRLIDVMPSLEPQSAEQIVAVAQRKVRRRRTVGVAAGLALLLLVAMAGTRLLDGRGAVPVAGPSPISSTTLPGQCPHLIPYPSGMGVAIDRVALIIWLGQSYHSTGQTVAEPGELVFTVKCGYAELYEPGTHHLSEPWPDGSSNTLPKGARVYAVPGQPVECALTAEVDGKWRVFNSLSC